MSKRKQVKNACVNCQKACKKCDDGRPCERCIKYGLENSCRDSARKERRRNSRRGTHSTKSGGDDGVTDSSDDDDFSSQEGSEDFRSTGLSLRLNINDGKRKALGKFSNSQYGSGSPYWNVDHINSDKGARGFLDDSERQSRSLAQNPKPILQVGAPNSTFIKALGVVCTDMLVKLEEEDLPPAVIYKEWPPASDHYFESIRFDSEYNETYNALLKQPLPTQRVLIPELMKASANSLPSSWLGISHASSPIDSDNTSSGAPRPTEMMTPPETPVNHISIDTIKHNSPNMITLPVIGNLTAGENGAKFLAKQPNHQQHILPN